MIIPDWPAPPCVLARVTTRGEALPPLPSPPVWLKQVHGTGVVDASVAGETPRGDASFTVNSNVVCAVRAADCMPVFFAHENGSVAAVAHAGWRGLAAGVLESTLDAMQLDADRALAWLGPAIGPRAYEIGEDVYAAFVDRDPGAAAAFRQNRPGHWLLDLYEIARRRLAARGVSRVFGGGFCTFSDPARFPSFRRDRSTERISALIWLESPGP